MILDCFFSFRVLMVYFIKSFGNKLGDIIYDCIRIGVIFIFSIIIF